MPVDAKTQAGMSLSVAADGTYTFPFQSEEALGDSCREFVLTEKNGVQHRAYFKFLAATNTPGGAGGSVPATLALTLGAPATFAPFTPGVARDYDAAMTANVISTAGSATLSIADPSSTATGRLVNGDVLAPDDRCRHAQPAPRGPGAPHWPTSGGSASPTTLLNYAGAGLQRLGRRWRSASTSTPMTRSAPARTARR